MIGFMDVIHVDEKPATRTSDLYYEVGLAIYLLPCRTAALVTDARIRNTLLEPRSNLISPVPRCAGCVQLRTGGEFGPQTWADYCARIERKHHSRRYVLGRARTAGRGLIRRHSYSSMAANQCGPNGCIARGIATWNASHTLRSSSVPRNLTPNEERRRGWCVRPVTRGWCWRAGRLRSSKSRRVRMTSRRAAGRRPACWRAVC